MSTETFPSPTIINLLTTTEDDVRRAEDEITRGGMTQMEYAIRAALSGDVGRTNAALSMMPLPLEVQYGFAAHAYRRAAEIAGADPDRSAESMHLQECAIVLTGNVEFLQRRRIYRSNLEMR